MSRDEIINACRGVIVQKITSLKANMDDIQDSIHQETKSSAGDKHETARAMAQLDLEQILKQLSIWEKHLIDLKKIDKQVINPFVTSGSIVGFKGGYLFLSVPIGQLNLNNTKIFAVSLDSPVAQGLIGKRVGESFQMGNVENSILSVS